MLTITDSAKAKLRAILEDENRKEHGFRVKAKRGIGPLSVDYGLAFVEPGQESGEDQVLDYDGFRVHIDPNSAPLLDGAIVDFVSGLNETGFKITNPKVGQVLAPSGPLAEKVQQVLDARINPTIRSHGGVVSLVDIKSDVAYLRFGGGCQGCGMVDVTLKQGVEVMLKEAVPELKGVMDITDHAKGTNPYYQASST